MTREELESACKEICEYCRDGVPWADRGILSWRHLLSADGKLTTPTCKAQKMRSDWIIKTGRTLDEE